MSAEKRGGQDGGVVRRGGPTQEAENSTSTCSRLGSIVTGQLSKTEAVEAPPSHRDLKVFQQ